MTTAALPTELFKKRAVSVVETSRVLAGALDPLGGAIDFVALDRCPIPVEPAAGRVMPPESALCGAEVVVGLLVEEIDDRDENLVVSVEGDVRAVLTIGTRCAHRLAIIEFYQAALDRLEDAS